MYAVPRVWNDLVLRVHNLIHMFIIFPIGILFWIFLAFGGACVFASARKPKRSWKADPTGVTIIVVTLSLVIFSLIAYPHLTWLHTAEEQATAQTP